MSALITIRMTLTGALEGKTKLLNRHQFINGISEFTGNAIQIEGVTKYFTRSYQVEVNEVKAGKVEEPVVEEPDNEAARVDDSDVVSDKEIEEIEESKTDPVQPNPRQADIIAAVNGIEKTEWVDKKAKTPRPKVKDVSILMEDPTVTKSEIIEVIQIWLS